MANLNSYSSDNIIQANFPLDYEFPRTLSHFNALQELLRTFSTRLELMGNLFNSLKQVTRPANFKESTFSMTAPEISS